MRKIDYLTLALILVVVLAAAGLSETVSASFSAPSSARPPRAALATAPTLGEAESYAVLGGSTVTNTGDTTVSGNVGVSPGSAVTGFPPGIVSAGGIYTEAAAAPAQADMTAAYLDLAGQTCDFNLTGQDLGGLTLVPGVYCFDTSAALTGVLTLNAEGDPAAVWVFQIGSTLTTASDASVVMINSANACNVYWQVGSSATLGTNTLFSGSILALTSVTLETGADVVGRALASNGAVTMDTNNVSAASCTLQVLPTATATSAVTATSVVTVTATTAVTATATGVAATATSVATATTAATVAATSAPTSALTSVPTAVQTAVPTAAAGTALTTTAVPAQTSEGTQGILPAAGVAGAVGGNTGGLIAGATVGLSAMVIWLRSRRRA